MAGCQADFIIIIHLFSIIHYNNSNACTVFFSPRIAALPIEQWTLSHEYSGGMNIMGLVVSAVVAGIAMSTMYGQVNTLLAFVTQVSEVTMKITRWVIFVSPIGIFFLIVSQMVEMESLNVLAGKLGLYLCTVTFGILFHGFVILPAIYFFFTRKNPYTFLSGMGQAIATAFGTASRYVYIFRISAGNDLYYSLLLIRFLSICVFFSFFLTHVFT